MRFRSALDEMIRGISGQLVGQIIGNLRIAGLFNERIVESMAETVRVNLGMEVWTAHLQELSRQILDTVNLSGFDTLLDRYLPPNWSGLNAMAVVTLIEDTSLPLVWLPDVTVVTALLGAPGHAAAILLDHRTAVIASGTELLADITHGELVHVVAPLREVGDLLSEGHLRGAQALAAVVLCDLLQGVLEKPTFPAAQAAFGAWQTEPIGLLRFALVGVAVTAALERFRWHDGDPMPTRFNRHASVHYVRDEQYGPLNALVAFMTAVGLARELQEIWPSKAEDGPVVSTSR